jgi:hypothetical protein
MDHLQTLTPGSRCGENELELALSASSKKLFADVPSITTFGRRREWFDCEETASELGEGVDFPEFCVVIGWMPPDEAALPANRG